ncbi:Right handed beta helix region [Plantibacter sp. VKM Ac-1784]|uniref:Right handed beta helix region n=1 Tax=Plantibacter elymi (nom. nud.) TaxID=199708 RepID=A0ABY1R7T1_9MICO|nr:right-handed parallel beta-helix repeat-containing protein [Plantibacter sp. VKM Ac-1784]SMQ59704.1 Right handed beta helix region [Plantibacter sp. VKM Ac-1784]
MPDPPAESPDDLDGGGGEPAPQPEPSPDAATPAADPASSSSSGAWVLEGPGIDPTGAAVSTAAVAAWFAAVPVGSTVIVRGGDVIALDETIRLDRRLDLRGGGELRFVDGIAAAAALSFRADGSTIRDIRVTHPGPIDAGARTRNIGIEVLAHDVVIDGVTLDGFQNGVVVHASGDFEGTIVTNCHILNIRGAGGGSGSPSKAGEDRGDGVVIWGARATVSNNIVTAAPGTDARIGIHAEGLDAFSTDPGPWHDAMVTIHGNVVTGPFRRSIALEAVSHAVVSANTVSDATWWAIAMSDTTAVSVVGNTIRWTRADDDTTGSVWKPKHAAVYVFRGTQATVIAANVVDVAGDVPVAIRFYAAPRDDDKGTIIGAADAVVADNTIRLAGGSCSTGIALDRTSRAVVSGNRIAVSSGSGSVGGVTSYLAVDASVSGNSISGGGTTTGYGVLHQGDGPILVSGNRVDKVRVAVAVNQCKEGVTVTGNVARDVEFGLDTFGSTGRSLVHGNLWGSANTPHTNAQPNTSYLSTRHMGLARPLGGQSGDILVGNGRLWVNDQGTWRSTTLS